jgi:hypothetical protein
MATNAFPLNPMLTAIAIAYQNSADSLIADEVLPRVPTAKKFSYTKYDAAQGFTLPDTKVGRKSEPTLVDFKGEAIESAVEDYGLDDIIPNDEIQAFADMPKPATGGPIDPKNLSTAYLVNLILLDREIRVANMVQASGNYAAGNTLALAGNDQWSDYANSDPLDDLLAALDVPLMRPNVLTIGQIAWTKLRMHPKLVQAVFGTAQNAGIITRQQLAEKLEISKVLVGGSRVNNARKGQAPSLQRTWGKHCALLYVNTEAAMAKQPTFGFTAQWGNRIAGDIAEPKLGLRGSSRVRVGESVKEVICAPDAGFLLQNVVA